MTVTQYGDLGEQVYRETLENGLTVCVIPKPGFRRKQAYFATDFGSVHRFFTVDGKPCTVPAGIAHFLEHKMFDLPGRDVMAEFAAMGVNPNAFTSYDMTAYYFSGTDNFEPALRLLLEFVSTPYFTAESVAKEQGIIGQEIIMNDDSPDTRVFENLMKSLYSEHEVRVPILGTVETIAAITPEDLYLCHRSFYRPDNMILCVVGDVDPEQVCAIAREMTGEKPRQAVCARRSWQEAPLPVAPTVKDRMEVSMPTFQLGFKCAPAEKGEAAARQEFLGDLAAEALFGESSPLYLRMYQEGIIDNSFGGGFETVQGMAMLTASGDSRDPMAVRDRILQEAASLRDVDEKDFLRMKRSTLGSRIRHMDSFDSLCYRACAYHFSGFDYFRFPGIYKDLKKEDVIRFIKENITEDRCCISVVEPL